MYESLENPGSTVLRLEPHARDKEQRETRPTDGLEHCLKIRYVYTRNVQYRVTRTPLKTIGFHQTNWSVKSAPVIGVPM